MEKIKKILEINHPSFNVLKDFFESFDFYSYDLPKCLNNQFIFYDGISPKQNEIVVDIENTIMGSLKNQFVIDNVIESIEYIKSIYNVKMMWLMTYPPKTRLNFHRDYGKNRQVVSFNNHERFFSYEAYSEDIMLGDHEMIINEKLKELKDDIDSFNQFFLQYDESCHISNLDSNSVYVFGNTMHSFINDSDKLRVNLVFEV
jgi:hypothetical protein